MKNKFPDKYIKHGKFLLHSGGVSNILYDVNAMLVDAKYFLKIVYAMNIASTNCNCAVGIATGGAILACNTMDLDWAMIKDNELKGKVSGEYMLIDDVVTTEASLRKAIKLVGRMPKAIFTVVDRRRYRILNITAMYDDNS